ncbi:hypothetical protein ACTXT7_004229 [Hymenolepis weldensis]
MGDKSHAEFYSQLESWVKQEQNRFTISQTVLDKALEDSWQSTAEYRIQKSQRTNTASIQITRNSPRRRTQRQNGQAQIRFRLPTIKQRFFAELIDIIIVLAIKIILIYLMDDAENFW